MDIVWGKVGRVLGGVGWLNDGEAGDFIFDDGVPELGLAVCGRFQAAAEEVGGDVFEFAAIVDSAEFEFADEVVRQVEGCFHRTSLPENQLNCQ